MLTKNNIQYVRDFLSGSGWFGELLLAHWEGFRFCDAKVFPADATDCDFRWSVVNPSIIHAIDSFKYEISHELGRGDTTCLFRECDFKKNDPCMKDEICKMVFANDDIFYMLDKTSTEELISETIKTANKFMLMCVLRGGECALHNGDDVTYEQLSDALKLLVAIGVGIFDEEGVCYIPFRRDGSAF